MMVSIAIVQLEHHPARTRGVLNMLLAWTGSNQSRKKINHPTVNMVLSVMPPCMLRNVKKNRSKQRKTRQDNPFTVEKTTYYFLLLLLLQLQYNTRHQEPEQQQAECG
mmetsp:Transcript_91002/g.178100  ORF Transcript_91002/g.178100 Transcript_91002/m.178100 type:complete len:108 (+) Transcript_91002:235-558(+)